MNCHRPNLAYRSAEFLVSIVITTTYIHHIRPAPILEWNVH
jgi:hypothetical protein